MPARRSLPTPLHRFAGLLGLALSLSFLPLPATASPVEKSIDRSFDAAAIRRVELENLAGEVTLVAASGTTGRLSGTIHAEDSAGRTASALAAALEVDFEERGDRLLVRARYPLADFRRYHYPRLRDDVDIHPDWLASLFDFGGSSVRYSDRQVRVTSRPSSSAATLWADFRIEVPAGVAVHVKNAVGHIGSAGVAADQNLDVSSGGIESRDGKGTLIADTGSGDVEVQDHEGNVSADTGSGDVSLENVRGDELRADTGSGNVALLDCRGELEADTGSGDIRGRGLVFGRRLHVDTGSGDVRLDGDFSAVRDLLIDTGSGDVILDVARVPSVHLRISTGSGDVDVDLPETRVRSSRGDYVADIGGAEGTGVIDTGSGDVTLRSH